MSVSRPMQRKERLLRMFRKSSCLVITWELLKPSANIRINADHPGPEKQSRALCVVTCLLPFSYLCAHVRKAGSYKKTLAGGGTETFGSQGDRGYEGVQKTQPRVQGAG